MKKVLLFLFTTLLLISFIILSVWAVSNYTLVKNKIDSTNLYTESELIDSYDKGYNEGLVTKSDYEETVNSFKDEVYFLNQKIDEINSLKTELLLEKEDLEKSLSLNQISNDEYLKSIEENNQEINFLENEITYYEKLLKAYQSEDKVVASFYSDNNIYNIQVLSTNSLLVPNIPDSTEYKEFLGWSTDNETVIDFTNYTITEDTSFYAIYSYSYDVNFYIEDELVDSKIVKENEITNTEIIPTLDGYKFIGWSIDKENVVDVTTQPITEATNFYAVFIPLSYETIELTKFRSAIPQSTTTKIIFDRYTSNGYYVDNINIVDESSGVSLNSNNTIHVYMNETTAYVLSNYLIQPQNTAGFFQDYSLVSEIIFNNFYTNNISNFELWFVNCKKLTSLNLTSFDTCNSTTFKQMFRYCQSLTSLDLSSFNTSKCSQFYGMFEYCSALTSLDLSSFDTSKANNLNYMFNYCNNLKTIFVSDSFITTSVTVGSKVFTGCSNLVGAISYNSSYVSYEYANYQTGYFTYKENQ